MTPIAAVTMAGCIAISANADHITLRDLVPAFASFSATLGDTAVAFAPAPGVRRIFSLPELRRVASRFQIAATPEREVCFERPTAELVPARLLEAMQRMLPEARIEILGSSREAAPDGELQFPLAGLRQTGSGEFWTGFVRYAGGRRFAVWAKVRVRVAILRVVATADLDAGRALDASQLRVESSESFPGGGGWFGSVDPLIGRVLRRSVRAGVALRPQWLDFAKDITAGDTVQVEVRSGGARLQMQAVAEAGGSVGQSITVRNPGSKKIFRARVEGKGRVSVGL